jgi:hypothetical protein
MPHSPPETTSTPLWQRPIPMAVTGTRKPERLSFAGPPPAHFQRNPGRRPVGCFSVRRPPDSLLTYRSRYARRQRQSGSDRLEKQPTDPAPAGRRHYYMRDGALGIPTAIGVAFVGRRPRPSGCAAGAPYESSSPRTRVACPFLGKKASVPFD